MSSVEVESGVRLFVQDWGAGRPLLFVHGWPSSHRIFDYQLRPLAERGWRVVALDLRGFGASDKPWDGNDYDTWARDLGAIITALDLNDVTLVGYSMGGAIAMHYAATARDPRITRLALLAAAGPCMTTRPDNPLGAPPEYFDGIIQGISADRANFLAEFVPSLFHTAPSTAIAGWIAGLGMNASMRATVRGLEEARDRDLRPGLSAIRIPTLIMHGIHDQVVPFAFAEEQQRLIAGSTLVPFQNSSHALFYEEQDRLNDELAAFAT